MNVSPRTLDVLEWGTILDALARECDSTLAADRALSLPFLTDPVAVREELGRVEELVRLAEGGLALSGLSFSDVRPALARAEREGILDGEQLGKIADLLRVTARVRAHLAGQPQLLPRVSALASGLEPLPHLVRDIETRIDARGEVEDDATVELKRLRERHRSLQRRTKDHLDEMLHSPHFEHLLQDQYVTVREGRYVLPFVATVHRQLKGIVHHKSQSGATAFMETPDLVEMNNNLTMALLDVDLEAERVLRELSRGVSAEREVIERNLALLARLDLLNAKARLGARLDGSLPIIDEEGRLHLREARHPLLALAKRQVVDNELRLRVGEGLVITGPNTGGKTVALKLFGLAALMAAAGLPVPAGVDCRVPLFTSVAADIGDDQSLERDLSTFSAHLTHVREILATAEAGSLVLLDELCVGTDPHEGAALASALLEAFVSRGCSLVVTTHYEELKAKAHSDDRFVNASFGYDPVTFAPSYRLTSGVPGRSGALDVAARLGLPAEVVERAREVLGDQGRLDEVIGALESERSALAEARAETNARRDELDSERERLEATRMKVREREQAAIEEARREFLDELAQMREEVRTAVRAFRETPAQAAAQAVREKLSAAERQAREHLAAEAEVAPGKAPTRLEVGQQVFVSTFGRDGRVVDFNPRKGQVAVDLGGARVVVPQDSLREARRAAAAPVARERSPSTTTVADDEPVRSPDITCDVRGMMVDDALVAAEVFLDRALNANRDVVFFIHGHGTGALKNALRRHLRESIYVRRWRACRRSEGGDGATVAWLLDE